MPAGVWDVNSEILRKKSFWQSVINQSLGFTLIHNNGFWRQRGKTFFYKGPNFFVTKGQTFFLQRAKLFFSKGKTFCYKVAKLFITKGPNFLLLRGKTFLLELQIEVWCISNLPFSSSKNLQWVACLHNSRKICNAQHSQCAGWTIFYILFFFAELYLLWVQYPWIFGEVR